jgi:hypothetical protein
LLPNHRRPPADQGDVSAAFELGFDSIKLDGCGKARRRRGEEKRRKRGAPKEGAPRCTHRLPPHPSHRPSPSSQEYDLDLWAGLLNATGKAYLIENCHWGDTLPNATWCPWSYYRSSGDIRANYGSIVGNLQSVVPLAQKNLSYSGCWAFPDALEVGVYNGPGGPGGDSGLSYAEARSHFAAWCIVSSPLVLGIDMTNKTAMDSVWDILTNTEAIAVNQAYFGSSGGLYNQSGATLHLPIPGVAAARSPAHRTPAGVDVATVQLFAKPLSAAEAARRVAFLREESGFAFCCYELRSWPMIHAGLSTPAFPRRRTYDLVLAVTLRSNGVTELYTRNVVDFRGAGFIRVINPID